MTTLFLKIELSTEDEHQRNIITDAVLLALEAEFYRTDDQNHLYVELDDDLESDNGLICMTFSLGMAHERIQSRYGIEKPFIFNVYAEVEEEGAVDGPA